MDLALIISGAVIMFLGRKLFWLFVTVVGFTVGLTLAQWALADHALWMVWAVGVAAGLVGALMALFIQKLAIGLGGFVAGAYIVMHLGFLMDHPISLPLALVAGVLGAVVLYLFFDWALIVLSSAAGATWVVQGLPEWPLPMLVVFWVLTALGIVGQFLIMGKGSKSSRGYREHL